MLFIKAQRHAITFVLNLFFGPALLLSMEAKNSEITHYDYIFAHGFGPTQKDVRIHCQTYCNNCVIGKRINQWNYPRNTVAEDVLCPFFNDTQNLRNSCLGQEADIAVLVKAIDGAIAQNPEHKIIGFGVSRGASTWINTIGLLAQRDPQKLLHIAALVLESPFCDSRLVARSLVIDKLLYRVGLDSHTVVTNWIAKKGLQLFFKNHNPDGMQPIKSIREMWQNVPKELPIFFIHSQQDMTIPINHSRKLAKALIDAGFSNVCLAETPMGNHANLFWGKSWAIAQAYLHFFYKLNRLPNNLDTAIAGWEALMQGIQPSSATLAEKISDNEPCCFARQVWNTVFN